MLHCGTKIYRGRKKLLEQVLKLMLASLELNEVIATSFIEAEKQVKADVTRIYMASRQCWRRLRRCRILPMLTCRSSVQASK